MADGDDRGLGTKLILTAIVLVLAIPGLVIEPGPFSELAAIGVLGSIWGMDLGIGEDE